MIREEFFNFGENWDQYSEKVLSKESLDSAILSIQSLLQIENLDNKSFLDVGCGSGLFSVAAQKLNASKVVGIDINPICVDISLINSEMYAPYSSMSFIQGSALDNAFLNQLGEFDIVYAWGSLHHTGSMWDSISSISQRINPNGMFVLSIYNKHFTSPIWRLIKRVYNTSPNIGKKIMVYIFGVIIFGAKFVMTGNHPFKKERGMDFWYDVIDWVGGYPYEYANPQELINFLNNLDYRLVNYVPAEVPTGCNEFVFKREVR